MITEVLAHLGLMLSCLGLMVQAASLEGGDKAFHNKKSRSKGLVLVVFETNLVQSPILAAAAHD